MRTMLRILVISVIHWILTLVSGIGELDTSNFHFFQRPEPSHLLWNTLLKIFETPLLTINRAVDPQRMKYYLPVMIVNSLLWGIVINAAIVIVKKRRQVDPLTADNQGV